MVCWVRICRGCWWWRPSAELPSRLSARGPACRLAAAAKRHRRSLNNPAILWLEPGLRVAPPSEDRLVEIRALRQRLPAGVFDPAEIEGLRGEGRP